MYFLYCIKTAIFWVKFTCMAIVVLLSTKLADVTKIIQTVKTYLKGILERTSSSECDIDVWFKEKVADKDAMVNVFLPLIGAPGERVVSLQHGNVTRLSIMEVNGQMGNSLLSSAVWNPREGGDRVVSRGESCSKRFFRHHEKVLASNRKIVKFKMK